MAYTLKVLSSNDFDKLPYKSASVALGVADPRINVVYTRWTALPELNKYLIDHELDHLVEETPTDEEEGVRYKKFRQGLGNVAAVAGPIIGAALAAPTGGLSIPAGAAIGGAVGGGLKGGIGGQKKSFGSGLKGAAIGGGTSYLGAKILPSLGSFFGFGGGQAASTAPNLGRVPITGGFAPIPQGAGQRVAEGLLRPNVSQPASNIASGNIFNKNLFGLGAAGPLGAFGKQLPVANDLIGVPGGALAQDFEPTRRFLTPEQLASSNAANSISQAVSTGTQVSGGGGGNFLKGLFGNFKPSGGQLLGTALLGTGLLKGLPKVPPQPQSVENLRSTITSGGSPLGQFGTQQLQGLMNQQFNPLTQPEIDASLRQLEIDQGKAEDQVRDLYRNLRPGTDPSSDTSFRRDLQEVQDQFSRAKVDVLATRTRDLKQNFDAQRMGQIQLALGASQQEMQQLAQIAQLDIEQIQQQLGLDVQQAALFKNTFVQLGTDLISPQAGLLSSLFGG